MGRYCRRRQHPTVPDPFLPRNRRQSRFPRTLQTIENIRTFRFEGHRGVRAITTMTSYGRIELSSCLCPSLEFKENFAAGTKVPLTGSF